MYNKNITFFCTRNELLWLIYDHVLLKKDIKQVNVYKPINQILTHKNSLKTRGRKTPHFKAKNKMRYYMRV